MPEDYTHEDDGLEIEAINSEESLEMMQLVFNHYLNHHKAVFKKLHHARDATQKSYEELEHLTGDLRVSQDAPQPLTRAHIYDTMWGNILDLFKDYGVTENELDAIDSILTDIPRQIKKHYEILIEQDRILKALISKLHTPEYQKALSLIQEVQERSETLTNDMDENLLAKTSERDISRAFKFLSPRIKE